MQMNSSFEYFDQKVISLIHDVLDDFESSTDCCIEFPNFFKIKHRLDIHNYCAHKENLKSCNHQKYGLKYIKVYKNICNSYPGSVVPFKLTETSEKLIFKFLKDNPLSQKEKLSICPYFAKNTVQNTLKVPIYRFCVGTIHNSMLSVPPKPLNTSSNTRMQLPIQNYKADILDAIEQNRVILIIGDTGYEKSTQVPKFLIEDSCVKNRHCRIISAHTHRISAINDSEIVASERGERIGITVGFQIRLESMSSTTTNLLYTTTSFFLRCLMGNPTKDFFNGITHVIINDIHERDSNCDLLIVELKKVLDLHCNLKVILTCSSTNCKIFEEFFRPVKVLQLEKLKHEVSIYHLEEIFPFIQGIEEESFNLNNYCDPSVQKVFENYLQNYMNTGSDDAFDYILYLYKGEHLPINAQHSKTGTTALMAAMRNNRLNHVKQLLEIKVNPLLLDVRKRSALVWGQMSRSMDCVRCLQHELLKNVLQINREESCDGERLLSAYEESRLGNDEVDHELLFKIINYINDYKEEGTVLIFLPSYEDLIKQQCIMNRNMYIRVMRSNIQLHLLHENILDSEIKGFALESPNFRRIVLSTDVAETAFRVKNVKFIIDTGKVNKPCYKDEKAPVSWINRDSMLARTSSTIFSHPGYCYRLFSKKTAEALPSFQKPGVMSTSLHKLCLYAKLLSQHHSVKEYFRRTISNPPETCIEESLQLLKCIGAMDEDENISLLGTRLVDIPVDLQLGKVLTFAIALRCLDPVLTIVSALSYKDPFILPDDLASRRQAVVSKKALAEGTNSDHLVLLRTYQKWHDERKPEFDINLPLEIHLLNGLLEAICVIRTQIIGALRAGGLIHSTGSLSMQSINRNAGNWALVKACFIGGMYPNICKIDKSISEIKSKYPEKLILHPSSVLRDIDPLSVKKYANLYQTDWILFQEKVSSANYSNLKCSSIVTPVSIAILGGDIQMLEDDLDNELESNARENFIRMNIDEWISLNIRTEDAYLLFNLRQKFFCFFQDILKLCNDADKFRKSQPYLEEKFSVVQLISKIVSLEEQAYNLPAPDKVGERPKALPLKYTASANYSILQNHPIGVDNKLNDLKHLSLNQNYELKKSNTRFFILKVTSKRHAQDYFNRKIWTSDYCIWHQLVEEYRSSPEIYLVVFFLIEDSKIFCAVGHMCSNGRDFFLKQIAEADVPMHYLETVYRSIGKNYGGCVTGAELPPIVGEHFLCYFKK